MRVLAADDWPLEQAVSSARILHIRRFAGSPVDSEVDRIVNDAAETLSALGHIAEAINDFELGGIAESIWPIISQVGVAWLAGHLPVNSE